MVGGGDREAYQFVVDTVTELEETLLDVVIERDLSRRDSLLGNSFDSEDECVRVLVTPLTQYNMLVDLAEELKDCSFGLEPLLPTVCGAGVEDLLHSYTLKAGTESEEKQWFSFTGGFTMTEMEENGKDMVQLSLLGDDDGVECQRISVLSKRVHYWGTFGVYEVLFLEEDVHCFQDLATSGKLTPRLSFLDMDDPFLELDVNSVEWTRRYLCELTVRFGGGRAGISPAKLEARFEDQWTQQEAVVAKFAAKFSKSLALQMASDQRQSFAQGKAVPGENGGHLSPRSPKSPSTPPSRERSLDILQSIADIACVSWARKKLPEIQMQACMAFVSACIPTMLVKKQREPGSCSTFLQPPQELYLPFENVVLAQVHHDLLAGLQHQYRAIEDNLQEFMFSYQSLPPTEQEELRRGFGIPPMADTISLDSAAKTLQDLVELGASSPMQKLQYLRRTLLALEQAALETLVQPVNPAPQPPSSLPTSRSTEVRRKSSRKSNLRKSNGGLKAGRFLTKSASEELTLTNEFTEEQMSQLVTTQEEKHSARRRSLVMQMLVRLILHHYPPGLLSHLAFIHFHTINDEVYTRLRRAAASFQATLGWILRWAATKDAAKLLRRPVSSSLQAMFSQPLAASTVDMMQKTLGVNLTASALAFAGLSPPVGRPRSVTEELCQVSAANKRLVAFGCGLVSEQSLETMLTPVVSLSGKEVLSIRGGDYHCVAILKNGDLETAGRSTRGRLGRKTELQAPWEEFSKVEGLDSPVTMADAGGSHTLIVTEQDVYAFGSNTHGQLGTGTDASIVGIPHVLEAFRDRSVPVTSVSCGKSHSALLLRNGQVFMWGSGANGRLGLGDTADRPEPTPLVTPDARATVSLVCCGKDHTVMSTANNELFSFGRGQCGQLGLGSTADSHFPRKLDAQFGQVMNIAAYDHTLVVTDCGLWSWGENEHGQLGMGDQLQRNVPGKVQLSSDVQIVLAHCGASHSVALSVTGLLLSWGGNENGQLGHGDFHPQMLPHVVEHLYGRCILDVSCCTAQTFAIAN